MNGSVHADRLGLAKGYMSELKALERQAVVDAVRTAVMSVNGLTGMVKIEGTLRDAYSSAERALNMSPRTLPVEWKTIVRFEFDKCIESSKDGMEFVGGQRKFATHNGVVGERMNMRYKNAEEIPITRFPQAIEQFRVDIVRLNINHAKMIAEGNQDGARKLTGRIRQMKNCIYLMEGQLREWNVSHPPVTEVTHGLTQNGVVCEVVSMV